jgi:hypothetical protein
MDAYVLPLTLDSWQVMTLDLKIDGEEFHAQVEVRYLPAPDQWFVSIWDHSSSELLVNMIPLICSRGEINDLLLPFRLLRNGKGAGSLICLRASGETSAPDPAKGTMTDFCLLWGEGE